MHVKKIILENFKVFENFEKDLVRAVYLIKAKNEKGKSSLIQAIINLLSGKRSDNLLQQGKEKGFCKILVGEKDEPEYEVECRFSENNPKGTMTIKRLSDGMKSTNISSLQTIFNYHDFDVNEFVSWSKTAEGQRKQIQIVRDLLTIEENEKIDNLDEEYKGIYNDRSYINSLIRSNEEFIKKEKCNFEELEKYNEKKNIDILLSKKSIALENNAKYEQALKIKSDIENKLNLFDKETEKEKEEIQDELINYQKMVTDLEIEIEKKQAELEDRKKEMKAKEIKLRNYDEKRSDEKEVLKQRQDNSIKFFDKNKKVDIEEIDKNIKEASEWNQNYEKAKEYFKAIDDLKKYKQQSDEKDKDLEQIKQEKMELIAKSKLPIEGLSFSENGLYYNGIPFRENDVSTSEQMEIATRIMIAKNPETKVFKIMQGESLDEDKIKAIIDFANKNGFQGFIEQVERGQDDIIIEEYNEK